MTTDRHKDAAGGKGPAPTATALPIDTALPSMLAALDTEGRVVLQAPPGAGKTTRVPLAILDAGLVSGRILMLEPRRLAARGAAERMAQTLGEIPGETVGYRMRGATKIGPQTRIEVVTEGILTRMIQTDPELSGIDVVIFDEFHERSLNADLGLALCWELRGALRDDLKLVVMSATLDAAPVAKLLDDAPIVTSEGRSYPVETHHLAKPINKTQRLENAAADLVQTALAQEIGSLLVFLPGEGEIRRTQALLEKNIPKDTQIFPLFGAMKFEAQRAAIEPLNSGRKIVLATAIAETSLTIQDIKVVVDCGRARRARFDPNSGMSRLVTEPVSRAEAEQRRGRAGRVAAGACYRLWTKGEEGALAAFPPTEIEVADLTGFALELAQWGTRDPNELALLTAPNPGIFAESQKLLHALGGLDASGRITAHGRALARMPVHPRLAHMMVRAGAQAAPLAALLSGRDPLRGSQADLSRRTKALAQPNAAPPEARRAIATLNSEAKSLMRHAPKGDFAPLSLGEMAALAYPDRIGLRRKGDDPRWILSGGRGVQMRPEDGMANARLIVATDLDGAARGQTREATIRQAVEISESALRDLMGDQIEWRNSCEWSRRDRRIHARRQERLGAITLTDQIWRDASSDAYARAALDGLRDIGLPLTRACQRFLARCALMGDDFPDMSPDALLARGDEWLLPHLGKCRTETDLKGLDLLEPLRAILDWPQTQKLDQLAPGNYITPLGHKAAIDYSGEAPEIEVRLQEMFGVTQHPTVGKHRQPLRVTLLSPARRPIQTTMDLPGFWAGSYADVRKDMRAKYPRHPWPEDPTAEAPTTRAKPRKR